MTKVDGKHESLIALERWADIPGFGGMYQASDLGRIRSTGSKTQWSRWKGYQGRVLSQNGRRYKQVSLQVGTGERNYHVHALVALAFLGPRPDGMQVCHCDGNMHNNRADNLRYDTVAENHRDKRAHGSVLIGSGHPNTRLTPDGEALIVTSDRSINSLSKELGVSRELVRSVRRRHAGVEP